MAGNEYQVPDLASVLRTLANLAPQNYNNTHVEEQTQRPVEPVTVPRPQPVQQAWSQSEEILRARPPEKQAAHKPLDPATILDWSTGLRCVMKTVAIHDNIIKEIRRMISIQHEHEEQWWKGRQALLLKQEERKIGQKRLDDVLKAVGGIVAEANAKPGTETAEEELRTFDLKVYKAQHQMVKEMSVKLKSLGVPFFGTRTELVKKPCKDPAQSGNFDGAGDTKKVITESELVDLQRKMLNLLEDLCAE